MNQTKDELPKTNIAHAAILSQVERLLSSRHFRQTRTLDKFLRHTVSKTLAGQERELKESLLGREVFHRGEDFNPTQDAVVRVQAGMLRKKLASYYAEEGQTDEVLIDLPKGCYVPTFQLRSEASSQFTDSLASGQSAESSELPTGSRLDPQPRLSGSPRRKWQAASWQLAAAFVVGIISTLALLQGLNRSRSGPVMPTPVVAASDPAHHLLWEAFFAPETVTVLAYGTPQFFQFNGLYLRDVLVNTPQEIEQAAGLRLASVRKTFKVKLDPIEVYTGVGEAHGIHTLTRFFGQHAQELNIARSRLVGWQEVKNSNLIFLSSMRFHTLAEQLDYPSDFMIKTHGISGTITNLRPATGEQAEYGVSGGEHYAVITLWPGKADHRRILQLSGNTTWGTLAAAEYATDKESLRKLHEVLDQCRQQHGRERHPPYFQVLVRAEVKDAQPIALTYVTHHDLEMPGVGPESAERVALK